MNFFDTTMECTFKSLNVRRSGDDEDKRTYADLTLLVELPRVELVAAVDVSLVALLFDNARMAIKAAVPANSVYFMPQDLAVATVPFDDRVSDDVMVYLEAVTIKVKKLFPADEHGRGAKMQVLASFEVLEKRDLSLLVEQIGEALWFHGQESILKEKGQSNPDDVLPGQEKLFRDLVPEGTTMTMSINGEPGTTLANKGGKLRVVPST